MFRFKFTFYQYKNWGAFILSSWKSLGYKDDEKHSVTWVGKSVKNTLSITVLFTFIGPKESWIADFC